MPATTFSHKEYAEVLRSTFELVEAQMPDIMQTTFAEMYKLGTLKGGEYAHGDDRLDNFRRNGDALGLCMETIWGVYAAKHWDAVTTYIRDMQKGIVRERLEPPMGRVDDLLVYLVLFKCMLIERQRAE